MSVPGKGMLFGEYGVMSGGLAVVSALHSRRMTLDFEFCHSSQAEIIFESEFLPVPLRVQPSNIAGLVASAERSEKRNLACYVAGWQDSLADKSLRVRVTESFSPELGFGSSSALLVAFQVALLRLTDLVAQSAGSTPTKPQSFDRDFWQRIYAALLHLQSKGSGYDVAVQAAALQLPISSASLASLFCFRNQGVKQKLFEPEVLPIALSKEEFAQLGCFVQTGVRSDTRVVLAETQKIQSSDYFCRQQNEWARSFCLEPTVQNAHRLCLEASKLSREFGLLPATSDVLSFVQLCDREGIAWKTMGAGHGDCLWVLAAQKDVEELIRRCGASSMSVAFSFAEGV